MELNEIQIDMNIKDNTIQLKTEENCKEDYEVTEKVNKAKISNNQVDKVSKTIIENKENDNKEKSVKLMTLIK